MPLFPYNSNKFNKHFLPMRIFKVRQIMSIKVSTIGMHNHVRMHIGNPEIIFVFFAVTQVLNPGNGSFLCLFPANQSHPFVVFVF